MDVTTGLTIVGGAIASKDMLDKVLGPTAEYVGGELKNLVQKCNINLSDVFTASLRKGAAEAPGGVDARTVKSILDDAAYCDDSLIKDYYGGMLCAAKSEDGDDEALSYVSILKGLSKLQVRAHFLVYALLHSRLAGSISSITDESERGKVFVSIGLERYFAYLNRDFGNWEATVNHVVSGLQRAGLVADFFQYGDVEYLNTRFPDLKVERPSLIVGPSILGVELFIWAAGIRNANPNLIVKKEADILAHFPAEYTKAISDSV